MTAETPTDPTIEQPGLAAPGPSPLESDDRRFWRGDDDNLPEGVTATGGEHVADAPTDPNLAKPGPHPHESADVDDWGGRNPKLPAGVTPWQG